jgi:hypothetical protein
MPDPGHIDVPLTRLAVPLGRWQPSGHDNHLLKTASFTPSAFILSTHVLVTDDKRGREKAEGEHRPLCCPSHTLQQPQGLPALPRELNMGQWVTSAMGRVQALVASKRRKEDSLGNQSLGRP